MTNVIIYDFVPQKECNLGKLVEAFENNLQDDTQGIIINEYNNSFLKATYWKKKVQRVYRFNIEKKDFDLVEEEIINIADFGIEIEDGKFLVFGNKYMAQRIITLIGIVSGNAYSITESIINIEKLVKRVCAEPDITFIKMKLADITIEKGVMVNCTVNLVTQDNPKDLALKYVRNIMIITFRWGKIAANITVYKSGKFSISKVTEDEKDQLIQNIVRIVK